MSYPAVSVTGATEMVPLSHRMWGLTVFRVIHTAALLVVGVASGTTPSRDHVAVATAYVLVASSFTVLLYLPWRRLRIVGFSVALIFDGVFLQYQVGIIGETTNVAVAAFLVAVCLLASFRTGLKMALWPSLLMLVALRGQQAGLFLTPAGTVSDGDALAAAVLLWLVVLTAAAAAAVNERELRRRRYDAEALQTFALILHQDATPGQVAHRSLRFAVEELLAIRALVIRQRAGAFDLVAGYGDLGEAAGASTAPSALFALAVSRREPSLVLRLDPRQDPWLTRLLPSAHRLIVVRLDVSGAERTWLLVQQGRGRGSRVERRLVATIAQLGATTALALSRAELLETARMAALLDPLTGIGNRRSFDALMASLAETHRRGGAGFAVAMVDVDRFKRINDSLGHGVGDEVLQAVAAALRDALATSGRPGAVVYRYGGEEFAVLLPDTDAATAAVVSETLRLSLHGISRPTAVTASVGVAAVPGDTTDPATVMALADAALYRAKEQGRDRVAMAAGAVPAPPAAAPGPPAQLRRDLGIASTSEAHTSSTQ